jgi:uncharacterized protein (TIGR02466 family)
MEAKIDTWHESADVVTMFPSFVWKTQLSEELHESIDAGVLGLLENKRRNNGPLSPGEAWQSEQELHKLKELRELVFCIDAAVKTVLEFQKISYGAFEITGCWANIYTPGPSHVIHNHPNNYLSGVYYARTRTGANTINFHDPRIQTGIIRPPVTELTSGNTDEVVVRVQNGTLLLFPSYLQHSVDPNRSDGDRISVSFNIVFSGFTEQISKPLWEPTRTTGNDPER